jgi:hypothetical protein
MTGGVAGQDSTMDEIAKYREMLADGNPAELFELKGEALWKKARGPKNASASSNATWAWARASWKALRPTAELFPRHPEGDGRGVPPRPLHGQPAGLQARGGHPAMVLKARARNRTSRLW